MIIRNNLYSNFYERIFQFFREAVKKGSFFMRRIKCDGKCFRHISLSERYIF
ncbi:MAG: KTSC domain-containing protein [Balneolaceae bacterium]|nr:MAG: KTSC domain-containing protein [Balneolaceae bacterium]